MTSIPSSASTRRMRGSISVCQLPLALPVVDVAGRGVEVARVAARFHADLLRLGLARAGGSRGAQASSLALTAPAPSRGARAAPLPRVRPARAHFARAWCETCRLSSSVAPVLHCAVPKTITQRELRNSSGKIMRALDRGESFFVTRNGVPVGELRPLPPRRFVRATEVSAAFASAPGVERVRFRRDLDALIDQDPSPRA